jgi:hypothetical protein
MTGQVHGKCAEKCAEKMRTFRTKNPHRGSRAFSTALAEQHGLASAAGAITQSPSGVAFLIHLWVNSDLSASCDRSQDKSVIRTVERKGKTYEQNTANIGKGAPAKESIKVESDSTLLNLRTRLALRFACCFSAMTGLRNAATSG